MINFHRRFPWIGFRSIENVLPKRAEHEPLREFVYLDEVSLASLLASQKGELTENITARADAGNQTEIGGKIAANVPLGPSAEVTSRFQTTNSSSLQSLRKANAQSLFRELHKLENLRKIQPVENISASKSIGDLINSPEKGSAYKASDLLRGDLVEFRVKLSAPWIFQISTMVAEFSEMFDESPTLFMEHVKFADLYHAKNANKVINKLLAGLVPINGLIFEYSVVEYHGNEYIVHNDAVGPMGLETTPLQVVGVTEHLAYWKDIRRVLFADNEFTMLCRLSKSGVQREWNPIKLADIFSQFAPDLAAQIEASSRLAVDQSSEEQIKGLDGSNAMQLMLALVRYKDIVVTRLEQPVSEEESCLIDGRITNLNFDGNTAEGQRAAFAQVMSVIRDVTGKEIDAESDLIVRERVRKTFGLPLFPTPSNKSGSTVAVQTLVTKNDDVRLLDVEVVAIYW